MNKNEGIFFNVHTLKFDASCNLTILTKSGKKNGGVLFSFQQGCNQGIKL